MCPTFLHSDITKSQTCMNMLSLHNQDVSFLGRPVPPPHSHFKSKFFVEFPIMKPINGESSSSFLKHLVTRISFDLLSLFILVYVGDAVFYAGSGGMELLE